jgi:hypothetical protein
MNDYFFYDFFTMPLVIDLKKYIGYFLVTIDASNKNPIVHPLKQPI